MKRKATPIDDGIRRMTVPFDVKAATPSDGQFAGEIEGYAAGIHNIDRSGDMILPGAFADTLDDFLRDGVICWQHDWMTPIGVPTEAREDSYGLFSKARISRTRAGEDCMTLVRDGVVKKLSIGYRVKDYQWVDRNGLLAYLTGSGLSSEKQAAILRQYDEADLDELFLLKKLKLYEYSPVTIPANPNAIITDAKGLLTGLTFADHSKAVLTAVQGLTERAQGIVALKQDRKTKLNPDRRSELEEIASLLGVSLDSLKGLLNEPAAEPTPQPAVTADGRRALAEFLKLEARQLRAA